MQSLLCRVQLHSAKNASELGHVVGGLDIKDLVLGVLVLDASSKCQRRGVAFNSIQGLYLIIATGLASVGEERVLEDEVTFVVNAAH